jgi:hypothetical protein
VTTNGARTYARRQAIGGKGAGAMTEDDVRRVVREEIAKVLDSQARRVRGITSWERYLQVLLDAARK